MHRTLGNGKEPTQVPARDRACWCPDGPMGKKSPQVGGGKKPTAYKIKIRYTMLTLPVSKIISPRNTVSAQNAAVLHRKTFFLISDWSITIIVAKGT